MTAQILDGKIFSNKILSELKNKIKTFSFSPKLVVILVGTDYASQMYVKIKKKKAAELGIDSEIIEFASDVSQNDLISKIQNLNEDKSVNAILVQLPLPSHIDKNTIIEKISPIKDVDGFTSFNIKKIKNNEIPYAYPCTPKGIIRLLEEYNIEIKDKKIAVFGRSNIVGKPLAVMLKNLGANVCVIHSQTQNPEKISKNADIVVSAIGKAKYIDKKFLKKDCIVIDVGINRLENGVLCGDVDFENIKDYVSMITPVPGGIGPMTIASLMSNTVLLFEIQNQF